MSREKLDERPSHVRGSAHVEVGTLMSPSPILVDARAEVHSAERVARQRGFHHLLVVENGVLKRVVCLCDLERATQSEVVGDLGCASIVSVDAKTPATEAAELMVTSGVGCLPVLDQGGAVVGIITRRDLRLSEFLPSQRGVDLCAACGSGHHLRRREGSDEIHFCAVCLKEGRGSTGFDFMYDTLGGSG
jgi:CBS domain-containing protein